MNSPQSATTPRLSAASAIARVFCLALLAVALLTPSAAFAALDMFLQIDGVEGSVTDARHPGAMSVIAFTDVTRGKKGQLQLIATKTVDKSSTTLRQMQSSGSVAGSATLTVYTPGTKVGGFETVVIEMTGVTIGSVITAGENSDDKLSEIVTLNFTTGTWAYTPIGAGGAPGGTTRVGYNLENNRRQ